MSQKSPLVSGYLLNIIKKIDIYFALSKRVFLANYCFEEGWIKKYLNLYFYDAQYFKYVGASLTLLRAKN
jgi:hypothetical protein